MLAGALADEADVGAALLASGAAACGLPTGDATLPPDTSLPAAAGAALVTVLAVLPAGAAALAEGVTGALAEGVAAASADLAGALADDGAVGAALLATGAAACGLPIGGVKEGCICNPPALCAIDGIEVVIGCMVG